MTPRAIFWHLIETKYSLTVNYKDLLTRHPIGCVVWKETPLSTRLVDLLWQHEPGGCDCFQHSWPTRKHESPIPCLVFGESRFPGNSQIPDLANNYIYCFPDSCFVFWSNPESRKYPSRPCSSIHTPLIDGKIYKVN